MTPRTCQTPGCNQPAAVSERLCADCILKAWVDVYTAQKPDHLPCGHELSAAHYGLDGTAYCVYCKVIADNVTVLSEDVQ